MPDVDFVGGKRVVYPVCQGGGRIMLRLQDKAPVTA